MSADKQAEAARALQDHIRSFLNGERPLVDEEAMRAGYASGDAYVVAILATLNPGEPEPRNPHGSHLSPDIEP